MILHRLGVGKLEGLEYEISALVSVSFLVLSKNDLPSPHNSVGPGSAEGHKYRWLLWVINQGDLHVTR